MAVNNESLLNKLEQINQRHLEIEGLISDPTVASNATQLIALSKEQGGLRRIVTEYRKYLSSKSQIEEAKTILADPNADAEYKELAEAEISELEPLQEARLQELQNTLVMADDMNIGSVIMEIRAGTGGDEAALFVRDLHGMYTRYAETKRWKVEQLDFSPSEMGGYREVILSFKGEGVWAELGYEGGGHRVQRVPETESQGRIHTSAATVAVLPEPEAIDINIEPSDVIEHVCRSSGPGGQNVNKTSSAIKLEHIPTGITVSMQDQKSQHKNRAKAWRILRGRIYELMERERRQERDSQRKSMIGSGDRSSKVRTYNYPQNRVTDHRIGLSLYSLEKILQGDMSELIKGMIDHDRQQRLENL
ncbi:MAG: peptide chain release factor 1 [Planctomycetes bacterium]|nr:peptide chain release factor 1 [Planctomycetota bacterium]